MEKMSFRKLSVLIAIPILLFFVVSGNGKFDWDKAISKIEKFIKSIGELLSNKSIL